VPALDEIVEVPAARGARDAAVALLAAALFLVSVGCGSGSDDSGPAGPQDDQAAALEDADDDGQGGSDGGGGIEMATDESGEPADDQSGSGPVDVIFNQKVDCGEAFEAATTALEDGGSAAFLAEVRLTRAVSGLCLGLAPDAVEADLQFSRENAALLSAESSEVVQTIDPVTAPRGRSEVLALLDSVDR